MTASLTAFTAVNLVSIAIMLAFVTLETKIQSDPRQRSSQRKLQRNRARRSLRLHRLRAAMRAGTGRGDARRVRG
jgi:hypothetical protein